MPLNWYNSLIGARGRGKGRLTLCQHDIILEKSGTIFLPDVPKIENMPIREIKFKNSGFYHVYNIGADKNIIFDDESDMQRFLLSMFFSKSSESLGGISELEYHRKNISLLDVKNIAEKKNIFKKPLVSVISYSLSSDHFHLFLQQKENNGTEKFMQKLGNSYGKYFANKYGKKGGIFAGRFKASEAKTDNEKALIVSYINAINPAEIYEPHLRLKGVENITKVLNVIDCYQWASHQEYIENREPILANISLRDKLFSSLKNYKEVLRDLLLEDKEIWKENSELLID